MENELDAKKVKKWCEDMIKQSLVMPVMKSEILAKMSPDEAWYKAYEEGYKEACKDILKLQK